MRPDSGPNASRLSTPVIRIFPPCYPPDFTVSLQHASPFSFFRVRLDLQNIIAQIFARDARPRSAVSSLFRPLPPPSGYLPYQHRGPVSDRDREGLIFELPTDRPTSCLPSRRAEQAGLLLRGKRVATRNQRGTACLADQNPVPLELRAVSARPWKSGENLQIEV